MSDVIDDVFGQRSASTKQYIDILSGRAIEWGLIGPREADRVVDRHVLNCAAVQSLLPAEAVVVDVGSGAGLPGIPLALARPDVTMTLMEPLLRRFNFLVGVVDELGLGDQVTVVRTRAEDWRGPRFDVACSRALAPLDRLIPWCDPLRSRTGVVLALKGNRAQEELDSASSLLAQRRLRGEVRQVRAVPESEPTFVIRLEDRSRVVRGSARDVASAG